MANSYEIATLRVYQNALLGIAEEMGLYLTRAAYSPNIRDRRDCSCAVFDEKGRLLMAAEHIPAHIGPLIGSVRAVLDETDGKIAPGDVFVFNDAYLPGGSHLFDVVVVTPVFFEGAVRFYTVNRAHHSDLGGSHPGGMHAEASEIYHEGLQIPVVKLMENDELQEDIVKFICLNVRDPEERRGDLLAQIASNRAGVNGLERLLTSMGSTKINTLNESLLGYVAAHVSRFIAEIPDGTYSAVDYFEGDGFTSDRIPISVEVQVKGERLVADFSGSSPQIQGPYNMPIGCTSGAVFYTLRCLSGNDAPYNEGTTRAVEIIAPEGSIVNPVRPAATGLCTSEAANRVVDVLLQALASAVPDRVSAGWSSTRNVMTLTARPLGQRKPFVHLETFGGGQGALPYQDGMDGVPAHLGNTANAPIEVVEALYPLRVLNYGYRKDTEGPGRFRGGRGIHKTFKLLSGDQGLLLFNAERRQISPHGLAGGRPGAVGADYLVRDGVREPIPAKAVVRLRAGDEITIGSPGGGGYGDPHDREREQVLKDVAEGVISAKRAADEYGVTTESER